MFKKLYNFYISYEEAIKFFLVLFFVGFLLCIIINKVDNELDKQHKREIDIIENTKDYAIFSSCKKNH